MAMLPACDVYGTTKGLSHYRITIEAMDARDEAVKAVKVVEGLLSDRALKRAIERVESCVKPCRGRKPAAKGSDA